MAEFEMRPEPTREQLQAAARAARLTVDLDTALQSPALALALRNTAILLSKQPAPGRIQVDHKRLAAGDTEE